MNLHKMIEICLKDDNMHRFVMINALICINIYVITCINSMLSASHQTELPLHAPSFPNDQRTGGTQESCDHVHPPRSRRLQIRELRASSAKDGDILHPSVLLNDKPHAPRELFSSRSKMTNTHLRPTSLTQLLRFTKSIPSSRPASKDSPALWGVSSKKSAR